MSCLTHADNRSAVAALADAVQEATGDSVSLAHVDQGYTGDRFRSEEFWDRAIREIADVMAHRRSLTPTKILP